MLIDIELNRVGVQLEVNYVPSEKETWGFAGGTPPNDAEFEILNIEIVDSRKFESYLEENCQGEIWKQINEELTLKS